MALASIVRNVYDDKGKIIWSVCQNLNSFLFVFCSLMFHNNCQNHSDSFFRQLVNSGRYGRY